MPTPDGREWLSSTVISDRITDWLRENYGTIRGLNRGNLHRVVKEAFDSTNYQNELKINRLTEKVVTAINHAAFGPLTIPNTVDVNGEKILTPVGEIWALFRDIYTPEFLDQFDEEGNLIEPEEG
jgi:hypothetical protein